MPNLLLAALLLPAGFEPARLERGSARPVPYATAAAGVVLLEVAVDANGGVADVKVLKDVAPFTDVLRDSVGTFQFAAATLDGRRVPSRVLVGGLYRPRMLLFPKPNAPPAAAASASDEVAVPEGYEVPPYPPNAIGDNDVLLEADVSEEGKVTASRVLTAPSPFDDSATAAARGWRFRPARRDGRPAASRVVLVFGFRAPN